MLNFSQLANGIILKNLAGAPSSPVEGAIYYDGTIHDLRYWNGTAWVDLAAQSGANQSLSNLTAPTAINQALLPDTAEGRSIGSSTLAWNVVQTANVRGSAIVVNTTGDVASGSPVITNMATTVGITVNMEIIAPQFTRPVLVESIDSASQITVDTNANATQAGQALQFVGVLNVKTANQSGTNASGTAYFRSGNAQNANSGDTYVRSGNVSGTGKSGDIYISPGTVNSGTRGVIRAVTQFFSSDIFPSLDNNYKLGDTGKIYSEIHGNFLYANNQVMNTNFFRNSNSQSVASGSTAVVYSLPVAANVMKSLDYMVKISTTTKTQTLKLMISTDGNTVSAPQYAESNIGSPNFVVSAALNAGNLEISVQNNEADSALTYSLVDYIQ